MKKELSQVNEIKIGIELFSPCQRYDPVNCPNDYIVTTVEEIYEKNGSIIIVDSDGDLLRFDWVGKNFFLSKKAMVDRFSNSCPNGLTGRKDI